MLHPAFARALATARIEELHREAAQIGLARRVTHELRMAAESRVPIVSGPRSTGRRDGRSRATEPRCIQR
jgi:hypothetical protein